MMVFRRLAVAAALLALVAAACGDDDTGDTPAPGGDPTGTCLVGTPDCNDTPGLLGEDEPPPFDEEPGSGSGSSGGFVVDGGLTVSEALATDAEGVIAVQGFVVADADGIRLCELLAESLPPLCGGASVELSDLSTVDPDELVEAQGVTWTDFPVTVLGELVDGVLVVDPLSI